MVYSYWLIALIVVTPLILGLPFLSRNRFYRIATLFAGLNVGIATLHFFISALRWDIGSTYLNELHIFFTTSVPVLYMACLITGSTLIPKYYIKSSTCLAEAFATFIVLLGGFLVYVATGSIIWILSFTIREGVPSFEIMLESFKIAVIKLDNSSFSLTNAFVSTSIIALVGADVVMRMFGESGSPKNEDMK